MIDKRREVAAVLMCVCMCIVHVHSLFISHEERHLCLYAIYMYIYI